MLDVILLALALCTDTFVASIAYGTNGITVGFKRVLLLNGICAGILFLALGVGSWLDTIIPEKFTLTICVFCLILMGVAKLLDYFIKRYINKHLRIQKDICFSFSSIKFIVRIYGDPMEADNDGSKSLSYQETAYLGFAMSIDSLIAGTMAAFLKVHVGGMILSVFFVGILVMYLGLAIGRKIAMHCEWDLSWLSGILFIGLGISKLF